MKKVSHFRRMLMLVAMTFAMLVVGFLSPGKAFACSSQCFNSANLTYTYSAYGMAALILDEPISSSACSGSNSCWFRTFLHFSNSVQFAEIGLASDYGNGFDSYCGGTGYGEFVFYWDYLNGPICKLLPTSGRGFVINLQLNDYFSNGGGMMFWASDGINKFCNGSNCGFPRDNFTGNIEGYYSGFDANGAFSSNKLTSATITSQGNQYQKTNGTWTYLNALQHSLTAGNPPWIGWVSGQNPTQNSTGGDWYTCAANTSRNSC